MNLIPLVIFGMVFLITVFTGLILSPYWISNELDVKNKNLIAKSEPRLQIYFGNGKPFRDIDRFIGDVLGRNYEIVRVAVKNISNISSLDEVHMSLEVMGDCAHAYRLGILSPMHGSSRFSLSPEEIAYINVAAWRPTHEPGTRMKLPQIKLKPGVSGYSVGDVNYDANGLERISQIFLFFLESVRTKNSLR